MAFVLPIGESSQLPKYNSEKEAIKSFLETFQYSPKGSKRIEYKYMKMIKEIKQLKRSVFEVSLEDVRSFKNEELVNNVLINARRYVHLFEDEIDEILRTIPGSEEPVNQRDIITRHREEIENATENHGDAPTYEDDVVKKDLSRRYDVVFLPDTKTDYEECAIRDVDSQKIGHYVTIKGMVTRVGEMLPMVKVASYLCRVCGHESYQRITKRSFTPLKVCKSKECTMNKNPGDLSMNLRGFKWEKYQEIVLQETSDQVPKGNIPRVLNVQLKGSVTQSCIPGDLVSLSGCFLPTPYTGVQAIQAGLITDTYFDVHHVQHHNVREDPTTMETSIQREITKLSRKPDVYQRLAESLAPEIYGHNDIKKALLLQMVSGVNRSTEDGMRIRGDINVLLMGDPGVAKSQLLKYISAVAPRGVYTTGKGSSSVGLTAGVVRDSETNEIKVEGGALVLADNGICCIDEFDKMNDSDRTSIHEVMEQQTISISKAGIQTTLNARVSLLCAANPLFGRYNIKKSPGENINLPTALLSRFDLIFLILDKPNEELDRELASHIAYVHKNEKSKEEERRGFIPIAVTKAYIARAQTYEPFVPEELIPQIADSYVNSRQQDILSAEKTGELASMTPRQLLSTLRLAQAHAKLHFHDRVSQEDVDEALRLMYMSRASVLETDASRGSHTDVTSSIYAIIRSYCAASDDKYSFTLEELEREVTRKGYSSSQFEDCLEHYSVVNAWIVNPSTKMLTFV